MPRNLKQFTECAAPGVAHEFTTGGNIALEFFLSLLAGAALGGVYWVVMTLLGFVAGFGCALGVGIGGLLVYGIIAFKHWYYNRRLMCIKKDQCAAGTVVGDPHDALDGDRKIDILLAPFNVPEVEDMLIQQLDEMRNELPDVPDLPDLQNRQVRFGYIKGLSSSNKKKVYIRMMEEKMFAEEGRSFQKHYYRKNQAAMGADAFNEAPSDSLDAADPNPMFRYTAEEGDDPEEKVLVPWFHCEVEGDRLGRWLENVLAGVITGLVGYTALCVACEVVTLGTLDFLCGWLGAVAAAILAFLAWLISHFVNNPDDGVAREVDVDVEDASFDTPDSVSNPGDVVYLYGDWIMDTEHDKYFEIHPVKAYYLLCRGEQEEGNWLLTEEVPASECTFDVTQLTDSDMARMCKVVKSVENTDPDEKFTTEITHAMAMMP